ncbi:MAG: hypothetical protein ACQESD_03930 [Thermoplasmatota archaeon]
MVETGKTVVAIEEKEKWESREESILSELKELKKEKKKLQKKAKKLKEHIDAIEEASRYIDKDEVDKDRIATILGGHMR